MRCFDAMVHDRRELLRWTQGGADALTAVILDSRTLRSTPESGARAGYDGHTRKEGSKIYAAVDLLGNLLVLHVTPANEQDRIRIGTLATAMQATTGDRVTLVCVNQGYTGKQSAITRRRGPHPAHFRTLQRGGSRIAPSPDHHAHGTDGVRAVDDDAEPLLRVFNNSAIQAGVRPVWPVSTKKYVKLRMPGGSRLSNHVFGTRVGPGWYSEAGEIFGGTWR